MGLRLLIDSLQWVEPKNALHPRQKPFSKRGTAAMNVLAA